MKIYQLTNTTAYQMMGYVIKTFDDKVIVIDGGYFGQADELYRILSLVGLDIDIWFLTHIHNDHYGSIIDLITEHKDVKIKQLWRNRGDENLNLLSKNEADEVIKWYEFEESLDIPIHDPQVGEDIILGDTKIEVFGVSNPEIHNNIVNNQSMVLKFTEKDFSILFLGDLGIEGGDKLLKGDRKIKSDAVQMAHHGQSGVNRNVYEAIGARYAFWPTPKWLWDNTEYLGGTPGNGNFQTPEVIGWMKELLTENITSFEQTVVFDTENEQVYNV